MRNANVIEFPKEQSLRKRLQDKAQEQKSVLVLSILSVLMVTVFLNQWLTGNAMESGAPAVTGSRGVASFQPESFAKDVKWEQSLAKRLASEKVAVAVGVGETPTMRDELVFGFLEGKYGMKLAQGRIQSLEFIDSQTGEQPMSISDKADFLKKFSDAFGIAFNEVSLAKESDEGPVYSLIASNKQIVGQAQFVTDAEGRIQAINFMQ